MSLSCHPVSHSIPALFISSVNRLEKYAAGGKRQAVDGPQVAVVIELPDSLKQHFMQIYLRQGTKVVGSTTQVWAMASSTPKRKILSGGLRSWPDGPLPLVCSSLFG
jgi:hypothetical protein